MTGPTVRLLDGALGTQLSQRGVDVSSSLFSARAVLESPQVIRNIHCEYLEAGADAVTTATFRTHRRSLAKAGLDQRTEEITCEAVELALSARDAVNPRARVLGSVGPLEDCYQPEAAPREDICAYEHGEMITMLLNAGVDGILIETIGTLREAAAAAHRASDIAAGQWSISFITAAGGSPGVLLDGESLVDLLPSLHGADAVGINCIAAPAVDDHVKLLRALLPDTVEVMAYGNVSARDAHGQWEPTDAIDPDQYAAYALQWRDSGASIIGGCCGTSPQTIRALSAQFKT